MILEGDTMPTKKEMKGFRSPIPTVDIIIEYNNGSKNGIVLIERKNPPYGIALPGGFAEYGLTLEENARKEALEETGLEVILENPNHPLCVYSDPDRDPRAHMISVSYVGKGYGRLRAGDDAKKAWHYTIEETKDLLGKNKFAFPDHEAIIKEYMIQRGYMK